MTAFRNQFTEQILADFDASNLCADIARRIIWVVLIAPTVAQAHNAPLQHAHTEQPTLALAILGALAAAALIQFLRGKS